MRHQLLYATEQLDGKKTFVLSPEFHSKLSQPYYSKVFPFRKKDVYCFQFSHQDGFYSLNTSYFIGIDWLEEYHAAICVESKLNNEDEIDFLGMLLSAVEETENLKHLEGLFQVNFDAPWIEVPQHKDQLSPFLIVQFLSLSKSIVRKGLKRSYYRVDENLNSKVKGKISVGKQLKTNIVQTKLTYTQCEYQQFGVDHWENQFLKKVLRFISVYLENHKAFFSAEQQVQFSELLRYCLPAFQTVTDKKIIRKENNALKNSFYNEYNSAISIGEAIFKRFSNNITKAAENGLCTIPPFWIDMSKLFELYVYRQLKRIFPETGDLSYHDRYLGGKETDILLKANSYKCVIDCKYKPKYENESPSLEDKRQLAGYTRLKSVYNKLNIQHDELVQGLIIYSHQNNREQILKDDLFSKPIDEYIDFYKLGIGLPVLNSR